MSTKREELSHILDQFNIQVDNPVSILNQDTSRNFLHSKSPRDKYTVRYIHVYIINVTCPLNILDYRNFSIEGTYPG